MVGEMRDLPTIQTVLTAAETGHLVFSTVHTNSAAQTIDRIIDQFPEGNHRQIRQQLSNVLQAIVSLKLVEKADGSGLIAAVEILRRSGIEIAGQDALVIGRSAVVGMPAAFLLVKEDATVTVAHSRTRDLPGKIGRADIVVVAAGRPGLVTGDMLKKGAVVVDVGINVVDGHIRGDVDFESARRVASAITPVPGGVGPLTNALLLTHLVRAAERQAAAR